MPRETNKPWFAPKRYGLGSGWPIAWQGWTVLGAYVLFCLGAVFGVRFIIADPSVRGPVSFGAMAIASIILIIVCASKTKGGWRWRWGGKA